MRYREDEKGEDEEDRGKWREEKKRKTEQGICGSGSSRRTCFDRKLSRRRWGWKKARNLRDKCSLWMRLDVVSRSSCPKASEIEAPRFHQPALCLIRERFTFRWKIIPRVFTGKKGSSEAAGKVALTCNHANRVSFEMFGPRDVTFENFYRNSRARTGTEWNAARTHFRANATKDFCAAADKFSTECSARISRIVRR